MHFEWREKNYFSHISPPQINPKYATAKDMVTNRKLVISGYFRYYDSLYVYELTLFH